MKIQELIEAKVRILNENKDGDVMNVSVPWIQSDKKNQNGRVYPKSLLQREIARVQNSVKKGSFIGTGDHPASGIEDIATASHIVTALSLDENGQGTAELRILPTERGKTIQTLIRNNAQLGVSVRGFGEVGRDGTVSDNYKLVGLDVVLNPSFKSAVFDKSNIFESQNFGEENEDESLEEAINELERESYLNVVNAGFKGNQREWLANCGSLREAMGLPVSGEEETPVQKLTEEQITARTRSYYQEAVQGGFIGSIDEWKEKFPAIVESASKVKIVEVKKEKKRPVKLRTNWNEVLASGFKGTIAEYRQKYPDIELILPTPPQKVVVETLEQEAQRIYEGLKSANPDSSVTLESVKRMLEKEEIFKSDKRLRKKAIYIVNASIAGSGSVPSQKMLEKMVSEEIEDLKKKRKEMRERNWACYSRLLD